MPFNFLQVSLWVLLIIAAGTISNGSPTYEVSGIASETVVLPCQLDEETCGPIHSIKWHKDFRRVYIFSEIGNISKAEDTLAGRAHLRTQKNLAELTIDQLEIGDEDLYRCEVTYLEARDQCALLQTVRLKTFAKPEYVRIENLSGVEFPGGSVIGPYIDGEEITLACVAKGGKPVPALSWYNNSVMIGGNDKNVTEGDERSIVISRLRIKLTRGDLGAKVECQALSPMLTTPIVAWVEVEVYVRPVLWEITGYDSAVLENTVLTLTCRVKGARPAANITWYNGTVPIAHQPPSNLAVEALGTYETVSRLSITVTRYDNGIELGCQTSNRVLESMGELPYWSKMRIEVNYKPVVTVSPKDLTVVESSDINLTCEDDANPPERIAVTWYQNGQKLPVGDFLHFDGGTATEPNLRIKNATKYDLGNYTCSVKNVIGETKSDGVADVNVLFKASVWVSMDPPTAVIEQDNANVTLSCIVHAGNPSRLDVVKWYFGRELQRTLRLCTDEEEAEDVNNDVDDIQCNTDPTQVILEGITRSFHGHYHCQAHNTAGWGELSPANLLEVYYPAGRPTVEVDPSISIKGQIMNLRCALEDPGRPTATKFRWWRGAELQVNETASNWTIFPITVEHRANFSCEATNEAGSSQTRSALVEVFVPPTFITSLMPEHGVAWNATDVKVTCHVECNPTCEIYWLKNGVPINLRDHAFTIKNSKFRPDPAKNQFESIVSTLAWNLNVLPGGKLNRDIGFDNYTCQSSANAYGPSVISTTQFRIEYPPDIINVTTKVLNVTENQYPGLIACSANGLPEPTYMWKYGDEVVSEKNVLTFNYTLKRDHGGDYECFAQNPHGEVSTKITINVHYPPECTVTFREEEDIRYLICTAQGNPGMIDFKWFLDNTSFQQFDTNVKNHGVTSELKLVLDPDFMGNYQCLSNNSVGSYQCNYTIPGSWLKVAELPDNTPLIFAAVAGLIILILFILCLIIIFICRNKRSTEKGKSRPTEERQNPDGSHVRNTIEEEPSQYTLRSTSSSHKSNAFDDNTSESGKWPIKPGVHLHVNQIDTLTKCGSGPVDGFSFGKKSTSSATLQQIIQSSFDPNLGEGQGDDGNPKAFYENLPFHGLQNSEATCLTQKPRLPPPNSISRESDIRPGSELSQIMSSGYSSTRSRQPTNVAPEETIDPADLPIIKPPPPTPTNSASKSPSSLKVSRTFLIQAQIPSNNTSPSQSIKTPLLTPQKKQERLATVIPRRASSISSTFRPLLASSPVSSFHGEADLTPRSSTAGGVPGISHFLARGSIRMKKNFKSAIPVSPAAGGKYPDKSRLPRKIKENPQRQRKIAGTNNSNLNKCNGDPETMSRSTSQLCGLDSSQTRLCDLNNTKRHLPHNARSNSSVSMSSLPAITTKTADDGGSWKTVPHPAPRTQTLQHSRRHTYQNIPFTRKTPSNSYTLQPYRPTTTDIDYADQDYRQLYAYGPVNYKEASLQASQGNNTNSVENRITSITTPAIESEL